MGKPYIVLLHCHFVTVAIPKESLEVYKSFDRLREEIRSIGERYSYECFIPD